MENYIDESQIIDEVETNQAPQIPASAQELIFNCIVKIKVNIGKSNESYGTGFFMKCQIKNNNYHFLVTCNHIVNQNHVNSREKIAIYYGKLNEEKEKYIYLNYKKFIKCFEKPIDITIIEILENDNIPEDKYLFPDMNYKNGYNFYLNNNKIYLAGYPNVINNKGEKHISSGYIKEIDTFKFLHSLDTRSDSSGSPICLIYNKSVIIYIKVATKIKKLIMEHLLELFWMNWKMKIYLNIKVIMIIHL